MTFSNAGTRFLNDMQDSMQVAVVIDKQFSTVKVYGAPCTKEDAIQEISNFIQDMKQRRIDWKIIALPTDDPAAVKQLFIDLVKLYGVDLSKLKNIIGARAINVDTNKNALRVKGEFSSKSLMNILDRMVNKGQHLGDPCQWCLCPVKEIEAYRLGICGHVYCKECLTIQVTAAINHRAFPITCAADSCAEPLMMRDIDTAIDESDVSKEKLLLMGVKHYVSKNPDLVKFCIKPDCAGIYQTTANERKHVCQLCDTATCISCHSAYHEDANCVLDGAKENLDEEMKGWMDSNKQLHKVCGRCKALIQKNGGCPHVVCGNCGINICWVCMQTFKQSADIFRHIGRTHPGDNYDPES